MSVPVNRHYDAAICAKWKDFALRGAAKHYQLVFDSLVNSLLTDMPSELKAVSGLDFSDATTIKQVKAIYQGAIERHKIYSEERSIIDITKNFISKGLLQETEGFIHSIETKPTRAFEKTYSLFLLTDAWVRKGDLIKAEKIARSIDYSDTESMSNRIYAHIRVAEGYRERENLDEAHRLYLACPQIKHPYIYGGMRAIVSAWIEKKRPGKALLVANSIPAELADGSTSPYLDKVKAVKEIAEALASEKKSIEAITVLTSLPRPDIEDAHLCLQDTYNAIFTSILIEERFEEYSRALSIFEGRNRDIVPPGLSTFCLGILIDKKKFSLAEKTVEALFSGPHTRAFAYTIIGKKLFGEGLFRELDRLLIKIIKERLLICTDERKRETLKTQYESLIQELHKIPESCGYYEYLLFKK